MKIATPVTVTPLRAFPDVLHSYRCPQTPHGHSIWVPLVVQTEAVSAEIGMDAATSYATVAMVGTSNEVQRVAVWDTIWFLTFPETWVQGRNS